MNNIGPPAPAGEWAPHRTLYARTLAEMVECTRLCDTDIWRERVFLRSFRLRWSGAPMHERFGLVEDEPASLDDRWDAYVAGYAQELCCRYHIKPPEWVFKPNKYLDCYWFTGESVMAGEANNYRRLRTLISPSPFLQEHGVLVWNRELISAQELIEGKGAVQTWRDDIIEPFTRQGLYNAFQSIAERMEKQSVKGAVYLVNGAAVIMGYHESRTTMDVDALIEYGYDAIRAAVVEIGRERGSPSEWLNEYVAPMVPAGDDVGAKTVFSHPCLTITAASPQRLIAMKMLAGREQDVDDIAVLLAYTPELRTVDDMVALMRRRIDYDLVASDVMVAQSTAEQALRKAGLG